MHLKRCPSVGGSMLGSESLCDSSHNVTALPLLLIQLLVLTRLFHLDQDLPTPLYTVGRVDPHLHQSRGSAPRPYGRIKICDLNTSALSGRSCRTNMQICILRSAFSLLSNTRRTGAPHIVGQSHDSAAVISPFPQPPLWFPWPWKCHPSAERNAQLASTMVKSAV